MSLNIIVYICSMTFLNYPSLGYLTNLYIGNTQVPTCTSAANSQSTSLPNSLHTSSVHVTTC